MIHSTVPSGELQILWFFLTWRIFLIFLSFFAHVASAELMTDPVIDPDGYTAERKNYEQWINMRGTCLFTRTPLSIAELRPNR